MKCPRSLISLIVLFALLAVAAPVHAQGSGGGDANGLTVRPFTLDFILRTVRPHIESKDGEIQRQRRELSKPSGRGLTEKQIQRLARGSDTLDSEFNPNDAAREIIDRTGNTNDRWKYFRGAELSDIVVNHIHDIQTIVSRFLSCLKFRVVNICIEYHFPFDLDFTLLIKYRFPTIKIETVDQPYKSGYFPRLINELLIPLNESLPMNIYEMAPAMTSLGILRANVAAQSLSGMFGHSPQSDPNPPQNAGGAMGTALSVVRGQPFDNSRWTTAMTTNPGYRHADYHLFPEFFNTTVGQAYPWCHHILNPWWFSDWPFMILPARFGGLSMIFWPGTMVPMTILPQMCTLKNLRQGKTPKDMAFPLAFPMPVTLPGDEGCQGVNAGAWLPVTTATQSVHPTDVSRVATMKALRVAQKLLEGSMYTYDKSKDRFQFTRSDRMPKGCGGIEKWKLDENKLANSKRDKDIWNVVILWNEFTCCMGWRGKRPNVWPTGNYPFRWK